MEKVPCRTLGISSQTGTCGPRAVCYDDDDPRQSIEHHERIWGVTQGSPHSPPIPFVNRFFRCTCYHHHPVSIPVIRSAFDHHAVLVILGHNRWSATERANLERDDLRLRNGTNHLVSHVCTPIVPPSLWRCPEKFCFCLSRCPRLDLRPYTLGRGSLSNFHLIHRACDLLQCSLGAALVSFSATDKFSCCMDVHTHTAVSLVCIAAAHILWTVSGFLPQCAHSQR